MEKREFVLGGVSALAAAAALSNLPTAEAQTTAGAKRSFKLLRIYTDANGVSHFGDEQLTFEPLKHVGDGETLSIHEIKPVTSAAVLCLKAGSMEDWHPAPNRTLLVALQGESEVTTADGEKRIVKPGMLVLMEDTTGKGHRTQSLGNVDHVALVIAIGEETASP